MYSIFVNSSAFPKPSCLSPSLPPPRNNTGRYMLSLNNHGRNESNKVKACFFNPVNDPIIQDALKEPVAFMGGVFAGLLRLDLNEEPLREWVTKTVESAGITEEEINSEGLKPEEEAPEQIEIE